MTYILWTLQVLLALLFLLTGAMKFILQAEQMTQPGQIALPIWFLRFIGTCEILGAIGLIVPALTRIKPGLTPLAAALLFIIMIGAVTVMLMGSTQSMAVMPAATGLILVFIAYGRWKIAPQEAKM
jgi:uncharacterized membrane protein YphA (DoxX/SURF4 family)